MSSSECSKPVWIKLLIVIEHYAKFLSSTFATVLICLSKVAFIMCRYDRSVRYFRSCVQVARITGETANGMTIIVPAKCQIVVATVLVFMGDSTLLLSYETNKTKWRRHRVRSSRTTMETGAVPGFHIHFDWKLINYIFWIIEETLNFEIYRPNQLWMVQNSADFKTAFTALF